MEIDALTVLLTIIIAIAIGYIKLNKFEPDVHSLLLSNQSNASPIRNERESNVFRSRNVTFTSPLEKRPSNQINTLYDVWQAGLSVNPSGRALIFMLQNQFYYEDQTYEQVDRRINGFGSGFIAVTGLKPKSEVPVGIYTPYSQESFIAQQAFYRYSFITVPIHDLRDKDVLIEIVNQTKLKAIVTTQKSLPLLLESLKDCSSLKTIIVTGIYISPKQELVASGFGVELVKFATLEYSGFSTPLEHVKPEPNDVAVINYNTKSSSFSKGVMLTHANLVAAIAGFQSSLPAVKKLTSKDRLLSHFSNGDVLAVTMGCSVILVGGSLVFTSGLMKNVLHDAQATSPTIFASTPVILEKIHEALQLTYGEGSMFKKAYAAKRSLLQTGTVTATSLWDFIGLGEVRSKLGGKVRIVITTHPTKPETLEYLRAALGIRVVSTFGRTEVAGMATSRSMFDYTNTPQLGAPVSCNEIKLVDDDVGGYKSTDEPNMRGEILIRGPNVMKGYFKKPNATAMVLDEEGWFHTGEIGTFHPNGTLEVLGKKKKAKNSAVLIDLEETRATLK
ncbi:Long-chain-fatty-acid--CoA ligase 6 [Podila humilis]|nr:Long-chain-fatty-acid--CoA ligase 6 [Podila humilis]